MTTMEALTALSIVTGPIAAVCITLWHDKKKKVREQQMLLLRMLISTRHVPSDPNFGAAINLIPIEFRGNADVLDAHKAFIVAASVRSTPDTASTDGRNTGIKTVRLIFEVGKALGFDIRETDIEYDAYTSSGWGERERLALDSQRAARDLVNILDLNVRLVAGSPLTEHERAHLRMGPALDEPKGAEDA